MSWASDLADRPKIFRSRDRILKSNQNFETRNCPRKLGRDGGGNRIGYCCCLRAADRWTTVAFNDLIVSQIRFENTETALRRSLVV